MTDQAMGDGQIPCGLCGGVMSRNPHPDAGKPATLTTVGAVWMCIPCTVKSRNGWADRAAQYANQLPDPMKMPASWALQQARVQNREGIETWVVIEHPRLGDPMVMRPNGDHWQESMYYPDSWGPAVAMMLTVVEGAKCRLVTPAAGLAILTAAGQKAGMIDV